MAKGLAWLAAGLGFGAAFWLGAVYLLEYNPQHEAAEPVQIVGQDAYGSELKLTDYRGKVVVLFFWGDW